MPQKLYILTTACPDTTGIVAAIAGFLAANNGLITEAHHHDETVVLNRAIKWHAERRVFCNGGRTVVLK
jgi:formyltetrahydrofolate hydrolase